MSPYRPIEIVIAHPTVVVSFCRRALAREHEILGVLTGRVRRKKIVIDGIEYPEQTIDTYTHHDGEEMPCVHYDPRDIHAIPNAIGTIHSHPNSEPVLSKDDMITSSTDGDLVFAVFSFWKPTGATRRRTSLDWYCGSPLVKVA